MEKSELPNVLAAVDVLLDNTAGAETLPCEGELTELRPADRRHAQTLLRRRRGKC